MARSARFSLLMLCLLQATEVEATCSMVPGCDECVEKVEPYCTRCRDNYVSNATQCLRCNIPRCLACEDDVVETGFLTCARCSLGYQPSFDKTSCILCAEANTIREHCEQCVFDENNAAISCRQCEDGHVLNAAGTGCLACNQVGTDTEGCIACTNSGDDVLQCSACAPEYALRQDGGGCTACGVGCLRCTDDDNGGVALCVGCPESYSIAANRVDCVDCTNIAECVDCEDSNGDGVGDVCLTCSPHLGPKSDGSSCTGCSENCANCTDRNNDGVFDPADGDYCHDCDISFALLPNASGCTPCSMLGECKECQYSDSTTLQCLACQAGYSPKEDGSACVDCSDLPGCSTCLDVDNDGAADECSGCSGPLGVVRGDKAGCTDCWVGCSECSDGNSDGTPECQQCVNFYAFNPDDQSCASCSEIEDCVNCEYSMGTIKCLTCAPGYALNVDQSECLACSESYPGCTECHGTGVANALECDTCGQDHGLRADKQGCTDCDATFPMCVRCKDVDSDDVIADGECRACRDGYSLKWDQSECIECESSVDKCSVCEDPPYECSTCEAGYRRTVNNTCEQIECYSCESTEECEVTINTTCVQLDTSYSCWVTREKTETGYVHSHTCSTKTCTPEAKMEQCTETVCERCCIGHLCNEDPIQTALAKAIEPCSLLLAWASLGTALLYRAPSY